MATDAARAGTSGDDPLLDSAVRRRIVDELSTEPDRSLTAAEAAEILGLHTSTARFHLDQLVAGQALSTRSERRGVGRPRKVYVLAVPTEPTAAERDHKSLQLLSGLLTETFATRLDDQPLTPEQAGEAWARTHVPADPDAEPSSTAGEWLGRIGGLTDVLNTWGYTPEISTNGQDKAADIRLTHCPFRELAKENPAVVCGIHRGLMRGTMHQLGERDTEVDLVPFAEGNVCIAHLMHDQNPDTQAKES